MINLDGLTMYVSSTATSGVVSATKARGPPPRRATAAVAPWRASAAYHHSDRTASTVRPPTSKFTERSETSRRGAVLVESPAEVHVLNVHEVTLVEAGDPFQ